MIRPIVESNVVKASVAWLFYLNTEGLVNLGFLVLFVMTVATGVFEVVTMRRELNERNTYSDNSDNLQRED